MTGIERHFADQALARWNALMMEISDLEYQIKVRRREMDKLFPCEPGAYFPVSRVDGLIKDFYPGMIAPISWVQHL